MNLRVDIDHDWTGRALEPDTPCASLELSVGADGLLVFNCMGGTAAEKVLCVEWATAFYGGGVDK